jgi:hypothetical protein
MDWIFTHLPYQGMAVNALFDNIDEAQVHSGHSMSIIAEHGVYKK